MFQCSYKLKVQYFHVAFAFGHLPFDKLHLKPCWPDGTSSTHIFHVFPQACRTWQSIPTSCIKTISPFKLIHTDTWGPYKYPTHAGHNFLLTIVDDYFRSTWTRLMQSKTNMIFVIKSIIGSAWTHFNTIIKTTRTDMPSNYVKAMPKSFILNME